MIELHPLPDGFRVIGDVDYENAPTVMSNGLVRIEELRDDAAVVDMSGVKSTAASLVVALMVAWFRHATKSSTEITFVGVPEYLRNVIEFSGLSQTLPVAGAKNGKVARDSHSRAH